MAYQYMRVRSDGTLQNIPLTFTIPEAAGVAIDIVEPRNARQLTFVFDRATSTVKFNEPVPAGYVLQINRNTKTDLLYKFTKGALWTAAHIDADLEQCLAVAEEARTIASAGIFGDLNMQGYSIYGLKDATRLDSPATYNQYINLEARLNVWKNTVEELQGAVLSSSAETSALVLDMSSVKNLLGTLQNRVTAVEKRPSGGGGRGGPDLPSDFFDESGSIKYRFLHNSVGIMYYDSNNKVTKTPNYGYLPYLGLHAPDITVQHSRPTLTIGDYTTRVEVMGWSFPEDSVAEILDWDKLGPNAVPKKYLASQKFVEEKVSAVASTARTLNSELSSRVSALENGSSGAITADWINDTTKEKPWLAMNSRRDYNAKFHRIVNVGDPVEPEDAVSVKAMSAHTDMVASVIMRQTDTKLKSLAQDTEERLQAVEHAVDEIKSTGSGTSSPSQPSTSGGSSGISCGMFLNNGQARTYTSGSGVRVSTGTSREGRTFLFTVPAGLWEIRSSDNTSPGRISIAYSGAGAEGIQRTWGQYTVYTVANMTSCTITIPASADTRSTQYVFTAIRIG